MGNPNIINLVEHIRREVDREVNDRLPRKVGITAKNHFTQNFRDGGHGRGRRAGGEAARDPSCCRRATPLVTVRGRPQYRRRVKESNVLPLAPMGKREGFRRDRREVRPRPPGPKPPAWRRSAAGRGPAGRCGGG